MRTKEQDRRTFSRALACFFILLLVCLAFAASQALAAEQLASAKLSAQQRARLEEANKLNSKVVKLYGQGKARDALALARQVVTIRKDVLGDKHSETAQSLNNLGFLLQAMGDYAAARPYLEQSLAIIKETRGDKHSETASALNNLGGLLSQMGDYAAARPYYEQALAISIGVHGEKHPATAISLGNLGFLLQALGDYATARSCYEQALAIRLEVLGETHPDTATSLNNLGLLLQATGDYEAALSCLERALTICKRSLGEKHPDTATSLNNLGELLRAMGYYPAARRYYSQALAIYKEVLGEKHPQTATSLNNLGGLLQAMEDYIAARPYYEQALAIRKEVLGDKHPDTATSLNDLGWLLEEMRDYAAARPYYQQALAIRKEILGDEHPQTAVTLSNLFVLSEAMGDVKAALENEDHARRVMRRHVARVLPGLSEHEQLRFLQTRDEGNLHGGLSMGLAHRADPAAAKLSGGWLLNGKAVAQQALAERARFAGESRDPTVAAMAQELQAVRRHLAALTLSAPKPGQQQSRRQELDLLGWQEQQWARQVSQQSGRPVLDDPWVEIATVQQQLPAGAVLVDIARFKVFNFHARGKETKWQAPRYVAWIIPPAGGEPQIIDLGEAALIDQAVADFQAAMRLVQLGAQEQNPLRSDGEPAAEKQLKKPLAALATLILEPLAPSLKDTRQLILSPDAALWLVPWGALPVDDEKGGIKYAIEKWQIRYVVTGRDVVLEKLAPQKRFTTAPCIFADPDFDLGGQEAIAATRAVLRAKAQDLLALRAIGLLRSGGTLPVAPRLPNTANEAAAIAPKLAVYAGTKPTSYLDKFALEGVVKAIHSPRVLVLSTHGYFLADQQTKSDDRTDRSNAFDMKVALDASGQPIENPLLRCGLMLAGCNRRTPTDPSLDDGVLTGMEIVGCDLRGTELVVLSACETGLGQVQAGEGVAGLRQAFQLAGSQAVVSTLWQISDRESARLMSDFFTNLAARQSKADALRSAQLAMIKARRDKHGAAHPFYWAAFTLTGQ